ncbi:MAG: sugar kinase [Acidobacteria bacterium]|nr:sugar kinase [Acidobacteriota bacterium]MBU1337763.1 sugar kinase [Acidobacteriota bacterium]MBU1473798.1 sugar kinase [Acidobacteriota bacterium]MBU2438377.1 sugar kinase [Acidobacteriota bacterium]MBU4255056.1 sugar kinase [Acidobacteriota bacterium]
MSLIIVGSMAFDTIETPFERRERIVGGSGTYASIAASFFTAPKVVSVVGEDFPVAVIQWMKKRGIDLSGLEIREGKTFFWEGRYGDDPNQRTTLKTEVNVFLDFRPRLNEDYREAEIVLLGNIDPDLQEEILDQVRQPKLVAMDTIALWIESKRDAMLRTLKRVDVFFANDEEIRLITRENNLVRAVRMLQELGPGIVVAKKGEHGALVFNGDRIFGVLAHPCESVVDPTGAGDSFAGGFLGYIDGLKTMEDADIRRASVYGSVMASFVIEDFGIERLKNIEEADIERRYAVFKNLVSF